MDNVFPSYDAAFYVTAFAAAAVAGIVSTFSHHQHSSFWDVLAAGCIGGFVAVAVVGLFVGSLGGTAGIEPRYIGMAILVGLTGRRSLKVAYWFLDKILKQMNIDQNNENGKDSSDYRS